MEAAAQAERQARQQAAVARAERTQKLNDKLRERTRRDSRDRTLTGLLDHAVQQRAFRDAYVKSARSAHQRQQLSAALDACIPKPPPEPLEVIVTQEDDGSADLGSGNFDPVKWAKKPRSWW